MSLCWQTDITLQTGSKFLGECVKMAASRCSSSAGATASSFQKTSRKPPDNSALPGHGNIKPFFPKNTKVQHLLCTLNVLYVFAIISTQMFGSWLSVWERSAPFPMDEYATPMSHAIPLDTWSQYVLFNHVLDQGKAIVLCTQRQCGQPMTLTCNTSKRGSVIFLHFSLTLWRRTSKPWTRSSTETTSGRHCCATFITLCLFYQEYKVTLRQTVWPNHKQIHPSCDLQPLYRL
ncbi:hypothetical protein CHARACLAT_021373 [Characodon lateralis]|uniref:Uncharacterized protein n=1 Tax=Characodon lateralis TaxID=208331 RepID=A0ABU7F585_9TELE|nr:hypothetical protein [Characodon lateralis]